MSIPGLEYFLIEDKYSLYLGMTKTDYIAEFGFEIINGAELLERMGYELRYIVDMGIYKSVINGKPSYWMPWCEKYIDLPKEMCN